MALHSWWNQRSDERYWLEITDRHDIGSNLKAPQLDDDGRAFWGYSLITTIDDGDLVYHYDKNRHAIVSWSRVAGGYWEEDIVWAARGTSARGSKAVAYRRPGWKLGLTEHAPVAPPVSLHEVRQQQERVLELESILESQFGKPLYLAFTRYADSIRTQQGYLAKLPAEFVRMFPSLQGAALLAASIEPTSTRERPASPPIGFGAAYRTADEQSSVSTRDPMMPDPALIERGSHGHAYAQNVLAAKVSSWGFHPLSPRPGEPPYDLAWLDGDTTFVVEVKSLTVANEERQLRLGLGQVLRYAHLLIQLQRPVIPIIMTEREPVDPSWAALCRSLGVTLLWPEALKQLPTGLNT